MEVVRPVRGRRGVRLYNGLLGEWQEEDSLISAEQIERGIPTKLERKGFCVLELHQEV